MSTFDMFGDLFSSLHRLHTEQRELAAIWLEKSIQVGSGRTPRIAPGETVRVNATEHKVIACFGTLSSNFELVLTGVNDNQPLIVKL